MFDIIRLDTADATRFRMLRLEALRDSPLAFGSTLEEDAAKPPEWYAERLAADVLFGALNRHDPRQLDGIGGYFITQQTKARHKAHVYSMYVRPAARGAGMGHALIEALAAEAAAQGLDQLLLAVLDSNRPAIRLYESCGFIQYGLEPRAHRFNGQHHDERLYYRPLA